MEVVHPICCTQKIAVYETKTRFYLVASNNAQTRFRVLKIDRTEPTELVLIDDKVEYNQKEIRDLLQRIDYGNRPKASKERGTAGLHHRGSAFGIVGFIKFLEGYYMVLISKRRRVALIGGHTIYKIDDTVMIPIMNDQTKGAKLASPDETRYLRIFQNVDLSSNFYFSYSYDLTHSLQYNLSPDFGLPSKFRPTENNKCSENSEGSPVKNDAEECKEDQEKKSEDQMSSPPDPEGIRESIDQKKSYRGKPCEMFIWNIHLLNGFREQVHPDWILNVIHGFVGQSNICIYGKPVYITLIARRSNQFAGTRFLKRGLSDEGYCANHVETEQIVHDASLISLKSGRYTSYTQLRGSVPFFWSQDTSQGRIVPKPQILVDRADPYCGTAALHFNNLLARFGSPIIILNLVKKKEKKPHEQLLSEELKQSVDYLNQFLPPEHSLQYIAWDMARMNKSKEVNVIERLGEMAERIVKETGFFHSGPQIYCNVLRTDPKFADVKGYGYSDDHPGLLQTGILRVNCVDCLDRTNTAQFMVGKCALGFQLYALGVTDSPQIEFDSDVVKMLEELFEAHGDTLAVQYGGSQMVHRIRGYRKISPWTSHSRDIMQTVSRYYSNAFTDTDKQQAINVFLGIFVPREGELNIWDISTDYYLHHSRTRDLTAISSRGSYTKWWSQDVLNCLPLPREEEERGELIDQHDHDDADEHEEALDLFAEYHRPFELTEFDTLYAHTMPTSCKDFTPSFSTDPSPFVVRGRRRRPEAGPHPWPKAVPADDDDDDDELSSGDDDKPGGIVSPIKKESLMSVSSKVCFQDLLPTMSQVYGMEPEDPPAKDFNLYQRYADLSKCSRPIKGQKMAKATSTLSWRPMSDFSANSSVNVEPPIVSHEALVVYDAYVRTGLIGPSRPSDNDMHIYKSYINQNYM